MGKAIIINGENGGTSENLELIYDETVDYSLNQDGGVKEILVNRDLNNNPFSLKKVLYLILIHYNTDTSHDDGTARLTVDGGGWSAFSHTSGQRIRPNNTILYVSKIDMQESGDTDKQYLTYAITNSNGIINSQGVSWGFNMNAGISESASVCVSTLNTPITNLLFRSNYFIKKARVRILGIKT